jgi:hypothetical protein
MMPSPSPTGQATGPAPAKGNRRHVRSLDRLAGPAGRPAPLDLTVADVATEGDALVFRASGTVDRYAHGVTAMRGMAARHLTIQITARATRA